MMKDNSGVTSMCGAWAEPMTAPHLEGGPRGRGYLPLSAWLGWQQR